MSNHAWQSWDLPKEIPWTLVPIAVLMDIREELRRLNALLRCPSFTSIPIELRQIRRNTARRKKRMKR